MADIQGTPGNDNLPGTSEGDNISAGEGNDLSQAGSGDDTVFGAGGSDTLYGQDGDDLIYGQDGNDFLVGGADSDSVVGGIGDDHVEGNEGSDHLRGDEGQDSLYGGIGNDFLYGGADNDLLLGGEGNDHMHGEAGVDTMTGGAGADRFYLDGGGADIITDFDAITGVGDGDSTNNDWVKLDTFYNPTTLAAWNSANPGNQYETPLQWLRAEQSTGILTSANGARIENAGTAVDADLLNTENTSVTCFARGTYITTSRGIKRIENLRVNDLVATKDHGLQPIRWIGSKLLSGADLRVAPNLRPVRIASGALGKNIPQSDLIVSPQHRILIRSHIAQRMFGANEVLVAAKQLVQLEGIEIADDLEDVEYFHILFDHHEVVMSNGAETESLYTGTEALKALGTSAVAEIFAIFPELQMPGYTPRPARPLTNGRLARKLSLRHQRHGRALVS